jgi:prepilin-type N-terminal cleavage/methylation domain-containing protein
MPTRKKKKQFFGFTLVEVITVLIVIAGLLIFSYLSIPTIQAKVRDARRKADLHKMAISIADYEETNNCYPVSLPVCKTAFKDGDEIVVSSIPCDPDTNESYVYVSENSECPSWFQLYTILEYDDDALIDEVGCRYGCGPDCQFNYGVASPNQNLNPYCLGPDAPAAEDPVEYVCDPAGKCEIYEDPEISGCPDIYPDDPTCQEQCEPRENRCKNERGKYLPD